MKFDIWLADNEGETKSPTFFQKEYESEEKVIDICESIEIEKNELKLLLAIDPVVMGATCIVGKGKIIQHHLASPETVFFNLSCSLDQESPMSIVFPFEGSYLHLFIEAIQ